MAKAKEIKIEWVRHGTIGGQAYLINATEDKCFCITCYGAPDVKVVKAKANIKALLPERVAAFIAENPGWKQVTKEKYDTVYFNRKS